ncbi:MAG: hypothetical protein ACRD1F_03455, partial [Terriglobales bacterium]
MLIPRNDQTSDLLPPLPEWRRELRERVEAYRASHPRPVLSRPAGNTPEATEPQQATDERVLPFRQQPTLLVMTASESAEPIADPVVFAPPVPAPAPEPAEAQLELASEPTWDDGARRDYLQLPLPMSTAAHPSGGRLPADMAPPRLRMQAGIIDAAVVITAAVLFTLAGWASQNFPSFSSAQLHAL